MHYTADQFLAVIHFIADKKLTESDEEFIAYQFTQLCNRDKGIVTTEAMNNFSGTDIYKFLNWISN